MKKITLNFSKSFKKAVTCDSIFSNYDNKDIDNTINSENSDNISSDDNLNSKKTITINSKNKSDSHLLDEEKNNINKKNREKIEKLKANKKYNNIENIIDNHNLQKKMINQIYLGESFPEKILILRELNTKINSYKQQDIKKDFHEVQNLITLDNVIEKLVSSKMKCYYCNCETLILFEKVRENTQWTLDRLNNYDEHTNSNTIISCLSCNLQRRRKNSDKFLFSKMLETQQLKISKTE